MLPLYCLRELQSEYRELCEEEIRAKKELCLIAETSALPEPKKKALIDLDNNEICLGIGSSIAFYEQVTTTK